MSVVFSTASSRGSSAGGPTSVQRMPTSANACTSERGAREGAVGARVQDGADDRDVQAIEPAELLLECVEIEQRLRRMLVLAVARVHDVRFGRTGDELRRADLRMTDDDHIRVVRPEGDCRVLQRLAL